nr:high affinity cAMP-specific and IBMX-insensitive 3',5'-cyclic phosphodiesterase 8B-like [Procambarus clarkii]
MGCTPSLHVSPTGVIYCRDNDDSPLHTPGAANHQPVPTQPPPLTHNQHQGPSGLNQHGYSRTVSTHAWGSSHPTQTDSDHLRLGPMKVMRKQFKVGSVCLLLLFFSFSYSCSC